MFRKQEIIGNKCVINYVQAGEIKTGTKDEVLISSPLGSCIAVVAYDVKRKIGGIAHVMLPGKSPKKNGHDKNRHAIDAIEKLLIKLQGSGALETNIEVCLIGGANVLKKEDDTLTHDIIDSVQDTIKKNKMKLRASSLGGFERRSAILNIKAGMVYYTIGGSSEKVLWKFTGKKNEHPVSPGRF
jgi:chemotaxis protein CheD